MCCRLWNKDFQTDNIWKASCKEVYYFYIFIRLVLQTSFLKEWCGKIYIFILYIMDLIHSIFNQFNC